MTNLTSIKVPIQKVFEAFGCDDLKNEEHRSPNKEIFIRTENGFKKINFLVKKITNKARFYFSNNQSFHCSPDHLIFENNSCKKIIEANNIDLLEGASLQIIGVEYTGVGDVYDVSIDAPHIYITPNGIKHHNTSLAKLLFNELKIPKGDILEINASRENNVDTVRDKIVNFCSTWPLGDYKIIFLDEFDGFSQMAQKILRGEMETHSDTARFILTANHLQKIIPALHSRLQTFHFDILDMESFVGRIVEILTLEKVEYNFNDLNLYINTSYPDLRKCINLLDQHINNHVLLPLEESSSGSLDYLIEVASMFKQRKFTEARKLIVSQARIDEYEEIYRYFYQNLDLFSTTETGQTNAIIIIARGLRNHGLVSDPEINLSACLCELSLIGD